MSFRCSTSDDQLSRVNRILDNEFRTSFTLFADGTMSQDVVDSSTVKSAAIEELLVPPLSPRQSRSCPCSPKFSKRTCSPESISNNTPQTKFSLSSSLLAIHRQASNSLMPEFLKSDGRQKSSPGISKASSLNKNLKSSDSTSGAEIESNQVSEISSSLEPSSSKIHLISEEPEVVIEEKDNKQLLQEQTHECVGIVNLGFDGTQESSDYSNDSLSEESVIFNSNRTAFYGTGKL